MNIITATEFRSNQRKYFDLAEKEPVFVTRAGRMPIALTPVDLDYSINEEDLKSINNGIKDLREGRVSEVSAESLWESLG